MATKINQRSRISLIGIVVMVWVVPFLWLGRRYGAIDLWGIMLIGAALVTFFGMLQMPGSVDENGIFRESQIRLAVAATLIVTYLVYFGSVVYLAPSETFGRDLLPSLTNLLMVAISFYFGSTAAIEIADSLSKKAKSKDPE